jgi:hypothetical protein
MYAITGITGKVGGALARSLLADRRPVRAVIRDIEKGRFWASQGCEIARAEMQDPASLTAAFTGTDGVFILPPSEFDPAPGFPEARAVIAAVKALGALSRLAPREVPRATGRLRQFLRASFDQQERLLVPVEEELAVVRVYLDIESLRLGDRLQVEQTIDPRSLDALMPPFSLQPLVENAVQHGIASSPRAGRLQLMVHPSGPWLEMRVSDDGQGVPSTEVAQLFFGERPRVHALVLLRRRLQGLFERSFQLEVRSELGAGTTALCAFPCESGWQLT